MAGAGLSTHQIGRTEHLQRTRMPSKRPHVRRDVRQNARWIKQRVNRPPEQPRVASRVCETLAIPVASRATERHAGLPSAGRSVTQIRARRRLMIGMDQAEASEIYERHAGELIRFATFLVGRDDAADVVSNAVVRVLSSPAWVGVREPRAYLFKAVLNESRDLARGRTRRVNAERRAARLGRRYDIPVDREFGVGRAVEGLSARQRAVVFLTYWSDLDPAAVSDLLGISEGTVRRHLARARHNLRKVLSDDPT